MPQVADKSGCTGNAPQQRRIQSVFCFLPIEKPWMPYVHSSTSAPISLASAPHRHIVRPRALRCRLSRTLTKPIKVPPDRVAKPLPTSSRLPGRWPPHATLPAREHLPHRDGLHHCGGCLRNFLRATIEGDAITWRENMIRRSIDARKDRSVCEIMQATLNCFCTPLTYLYFTVSPTCGPMRACGVMLRMVALRRPLLVVRVLFCSVIYS